MKIEIETRFSKCFRCKKQLPRSYARKTSAFCAACRATARTERQPWYHGACLNNCGRPGRGRSGFCFSCWGLLRARQRRRKKLLYEILGDDYAPIDAIARALRTPGEQRYACELAARIFDAISECKITLSKYPYPHWLYPDRTPRVITDEMGSRIRKRLPVSYDSNVTERSS